MSGGAYSSDLSVEDIKIKIQQTSGNPNIGNTHQVVLKDGPRTYRIATIFEIIKPTTQELHHLSLQIDSFDKIKKAWREKPDKKIRIDGKEPDEIKMLSDFLSAVLSEHYPGRAGEVRVIPSAQYTILENVARILPKLPGPRKIELIKQVLQSLEETDLDLEEFIDVFRNSTPEAVKHIGVAAKYVQYRSAFDELEQLIQTSDPSESKFQNHLRKNSWMFGSEYSELLDRRTWTRDANLDFMLRRTVDNYLEIVEIKTPATMPLFNYDSSHDSYYASAKLSQVLVQVNRYIEEVERNRDTIIAKDRVDPLKIRARIIVGMDGDEEQQAALRTLNSHLNRIEILTFAQLLRVAKRTLDIFQSQISDRRAANEPEEWEDVPF